MVDEIDLIWLGQTDEAGSGTSHGPSVALEAGGYLLLEAGDTILLEG